MQVTRISEHLPLVNDGKYLGTGEHVQCAGQSSGRRY